MKAMICISSLSGTALNEGFHGMPAALLPIANKPLIEYYIELCSCLGIGEVLILDRDYSDEAAAFLGDGSRWTVPVSYRGSRPLTSFLALRQRQAAFIGDDDVLCFSGFFFPACDYRVVSLDKLTAGAPQDAEAALGPGLYWLRQKQCHAIALASLPLQTCLDYFNCNMTVLNAEDGFFPVPGYHVEAGIYTGMNVVFPPSCTIASPALIGNHVRLVDEVSLEGEVILGDHVMVDRQTSLRRTVVIDNTYVGGDLELQEKIVCRDRIIDPKDGTVLRLDDDSLLMEVRSFQWQRILGWMLDALLALLLLIWLTPWFVLFRLLVRLKPKPHDFQSVCGHLHQYPQYQLNPWKRSHLYFYKLLLDKYLLLPYVFRGDLVLVGESITRCPDATELSYRPGVFCTSDLHQGLVSPLQQKLDDRYFRHNRSVRQKIRCLGKIMINRLFASTQAFYRQAEWSGISTDSR